MNLLLKLAPFLKQIDLILKESSVFRGLICLVVMIETVFLIFLVNMWITNFMDITKYRDELNKKTKN